MKKVKVLYFVDRMLRGGIQSLVIDWVSRFDKNIIQVDFLLLDDGNKYELEDTLKELGCKVYKLKKTWVKTPFDYINYNKKAKSFFKEHNDYDVIHFHSSSKNYPILKYAKKYNIPVRIAHSHNTDFQTTSIIKKYIGNLLKKDLLEYSTDYFACSKVAGEWLFGSEMHEKGKVRIIHNAVDYEKFKFNNKKREKIRKEFGIKSDEILIGNVGRFTTQKNHLFLIEIFNELKKLNKKYKLILVGIGEKEEEIKSKVKELKLTDSVIFAGFRKDVNDIMQGLDLFLLPSLYEGLPVVGVEAQAAGLPCVMSKDVITSEVKIIPKVKFIPLSEGANVWAREIDEYDKDRYDSREALKSSKFFIEDIIEELTNFYLGER